MSQDAGERLLAVISRLNRWATHQADIPLPTASLRLLALVDQVGPARIGELAARDHCSQPTMSSQVQRLETAGLLARTSDPDDARVSVIALTPKGREMLSTTRVARARALAPVLAQLDASQGDRLTVAIDVLEELLARTEGR